MADKLSKAAQELGRVGGKSTSAAKQAASRENGKLGGRPSTTTAEQRQLAADIFSSGDGTVENADRQAANFTALLDYLGEQGITDSGGEEAVWAWFINDKNSLSTEFDPAGFCGDS